MAAQTGAVLTGVALDMEIQRVLASMPGS